MGWVAALRTSRTRRTGGPRGGMRRRVAPRRGTIPARRWGLDARAPRVPRGGQERCPTRVEGPSPWPLHPRRTVREVPPRGGPTMRIWPGTPAPLGATWDGTGVNFALFSAHATQVELCVFERADAAQETHRLPLPAFWG